MRDIQLTHDRVVLDWARRGDREAFDVLWERHGTVAWHLATVITRDAAAAAEVVADRFAAVLASGHAVNTDVPVRAQILAAVRHGALTADPASVHRYQPTSAVGVAFAELPERWRSALWLGEVEGLPAKEVGLSLEVEPATVGALLDRAHAGLAAQVVDHGLEPEAGDDLPAALQGLALLVPVALPVTTRKRWHHQLVRRRGPLGLALPGGRSATPWMERVLAGSAAAVVTLGISAAILLGGRDGQAPGARIGQTASEPFGAPDGESAFGGDDPLAPLVPDTTGPIPGTSAATSAPAPTEVVEEPAPPVEQGPAPAAVAPAPEPEVVPEAPAPEPEAEAAPEPPAIEIVVGVEGVLGISLGDCTGLAIAGTAIGCEPPAAEGPIDLRVGGSLLGGSLLGL